MKIVPLVTGRIGVSPNMAIIWHPGTPDLIWDSHHEGWGLLLLTLACYQQHHQTDGTLWTFRHNLKHCWVSLCLLLKCSFQRWHFVHQRTLAVEVGVSSKITWRLYHAALGLTTSFIGIFYTPMFLLTSSDLMMGYISVAPVEGPGPVLGIPLIVNNNDHHQQTLLSPTAAW